MSLLLSMLLTSALAWDLEAAEPVDLPEGEEALGLVMLDSGMALVTGGEASWSIMDPLTGEILAAYETSAVAAAGMDVDGDGYEDVLLCADDGLWVVYTGTDPVGPDPLDALPCAAVTGGLAPAATDGTEVRVYSDIPEVGGSYEAATGSPPVLVGSDSAFAVTAPGDWSVHEVRGMAVTTLTAGGKVHDLVAHGDAWAWSLVEEAQVVVDGVAVDVGNRPGPLASADLSGDGEASLVVVYPTHGEVGVLLEGGGERIFDLGAGAVDVLSGPLDGDGCEDLLLVGEGQVVPALVSSCESGGDTGEQCADAEVRVSRSGASEEGRRLRYELDYDPGCYPDADPHWEVDAPMTLVAECMEKPSGLACDLLDDGEFIVRLQLLGAGGEELAAWQEAVRVENRPPELLYFPTFLNLGDVLVDEPLQARDVPADVVSWTLVDAPQGMTLTAEGLLSYSADEEGWWEITVALSDEDGGSALYEVWFEVWSDGWDDDPDDGEGGPGCCCASTAATGLLPFVLLLGLRRRVL